MAKPEEYVKTDIAPCCDSVKAIEKKEKQNTPSSPLCDKPQPCMVSKNQGPDKKEEEKFNCDPVPHDLREQSPQDKFCPLVVSDESSTSPDASNTTNDDSGDTATTDHVMTGGNIKVEENKSNNKEVSLFDFL